MVTSIADRPRCAILIVNWNSWALLTQCLTAVMQQSYRHFRVLVADNASTQLMPTTLATQFPEVLFIQNATNVGFAAANNQLVDLCPECQWIALLNPDAFPTTTWLEQLVQAALQAETQCAIFGSRLLMAHAPEYLDGDGDLYHVSGLAVRIDHGKRATTKQTLIPVFSACAAAALYRRDVFIAVGGFDVNYFCYFEDVDLGFRFQLAGYSSILVTPAVVYHVGSATSGGQDSDFALYHGQRNLVWTFIKNMPGALFWLLLPYHVMLNLVTLLLFSYRGRGAVIMRAKRDALRQLPYYWRQRRFIQSARRVAPAIIWRQLDKRNPLHFLRSWQQRRTPTSSVSQW